MSALSPSKSKLWYNNPITTFLTGFVPKKHGRWHSFYWCSQCSRYLQRIRTCHCTACQRRDLRKLPKRIRIRSRRSYPMRHARHNAKPLLLSQAGSNIINPQATADCQLCPLSNTNGFLSAINSSYSLRFRNFGIIVSRIA